MPSWDGTLEQRIVPMFRSPNLPGLVSCRLAAALVGVLLGLAIFTAPAPAADLAQPSQPALPTLTNAQQVIDLGMEGARLNPHPVHFRGVLTYVAITHQNWIFVQDQTAGLLVTYDSFAGVPKAGQLVEVDGTAGVGDFHTFVKFAKVSVLGESPWPVPRQTPIEKLVQGADFAQWVRLQGTVLDAGIEGERLVFLMQSHGVPYHVWVRRPEGWPLPIDWIDADLEVEGVVWTATDQSNHPVSIRLHVPDMTHVRLVHPGSTNTFDKKLETTRSLRKSPRLRDQRVRVRGIVTLAEPDGSTVYIQDESGPVVVQLLRPIRRQAFFLHALRPASSQTVKGADAMPLQVGDWIEVVGSPSPDTPFAPTLISAEYHLLAHRDAPQARATSVSDALRPESDGELIRLPARFIDLDHTPAPKGVVTRLWLESDGLIFEARLTTPQATKLSLADNSLMEVTGVCSSIAGDLRKARGVRLRLRDEQDIRVLHEPAPWIGPGGRRLMLAAGGLLVAVLGWVAMLRRQVRQRTGELQAANQALRENIEQHQRIETALAESEARYRTLTESAPEAIVVFDAATGRFETSNENAKGLFGLTSEALSKIGPADVSPEFQPDGRRSDESAQAWIQRAMAGETPIFEWVCRHSSGRLVPCEVRLVRLTHQGRPLLRGTIIDNSERRRRELVQRATYQISEAVHAVDDLRSLYQRIHGIVKGLMPADNFFLLLHDPVTDLHVYAYHIDQMDAWPAPRKVSGGLVGYILRTSKPLLTDRDSMMDERNEWHYVSGTPSAVWLGVPLIVRGKTIGVMAVQHYHNPKAYGEEEKQILTYVASQTALAIDRKQADAALAESEARTRLIVDNALDAVITMDAEGQIRGWNSQAEQTFGWPAREAMGRTLADLIIPPDQREAHQRGLHQFLRSHDGPVVNQRIEVMALHRDGRTFPVELAIAPLRLGNSWIFSGFARDISERKKAEDDMQRALMREKELGALKTNFVSLVSHEFRTPLGVIMSASEILDRYFDRLPPEKRRKHLDMVFRATKNLAELVEGVLLLGKVEEGRMQFSPAPIDLATFSRELVDEIAAATGRHCPIELVLGEGLPEAAGDSVLLRHILSNILSNAVKYSEPGRAVSFTIERCEGSARFQVRDQGIGIPEEDREKLFKSFSRGRNVGSIPGTGLGLLIVKRCVDLHGGSIEIHSRSGHGTTVIVDLPLFTELSIQQPLEIST